MKKLALLLVLVVIVASFYFLYFNSQNSNPTTQNPIKSTPSEDEIPEVSNNVPQNIKVDNSYNIGIFAEDLPGARDLEFAPNGTLLVSLTRQGRVVALPDNNRDGEADENITILSNLNRPHGMAFHNGMLYLAEENQVTRYTYDTSTNNVIFDKKLFDLPSGGRHFTRSLVFDDDNNLYVSLGSTCDTCIESHPYISTVLISNSDGENLRVYSEGLRNAVFLTKHPITGQVYVTEMGRDFLGDNLPPDEINILQENGDFGWPYCYGDQVWDSTFGRQSPSYCENTIAPFYNLPAHVAPLGLTFIDSTQFPEDWQNDLLVALHGSWNSTIPVGYKVVRIDTDSKTLEDFITGFEDNVARPVDVIFDNTGSLFISDDEAGRVYKVIQSN